MVIAARYWLAPLLGSGHIRERNRTHRPRKVGCNWNGEPGVPPSLGVYPQKTMVLNEKVLASNALTARLENCPGVRPFDKLNERSKP